MILLNLHFIEYFNISICIYIIHSIGQDKFTYDAEILVRFTLVDHTNCNQGERFIQIPFIHLLPVRHTAFDVHAIFVVDGYTEREYRHLATHNRTNFVVYYPRISSGFDDLSLCSTRRRGI